MNRFRTFSNKFQTRNKTGSSTRQIYNFEKNNRRQNYDNHLDFEFKQQIINYIYSSIDLSNFKYKLIEYEYDLPLLKEKTYFVSPNYNGIPCLLIFKKIKNRFLSFLVDRKTLTYNQNQIDINKVKFIPISVTLSQEIYEGSILDGVLLYNNYNNMQHFVINDVYYFCGINLLNDKLNNKILNLTTYFNSIHENFFEDNFKFTINKYYQLNEINNLINKIIPTSLLNKSIKGVSFNCEFSCSKLIYLFNNSLEKNSHDCNINHINIEKKILNNEIDNINSIQKSFQFLNSTKDNKSNDETNTSTSCDDINKSALNTTKVPKEGCKAPIMQPEKIFANFKMKKTETIDVYNLYLGEIEIINNQKVFKYVKIGIASIPTMECSVYCKKIFDSIPLDYIIIQCQFHQDKNKWIPIKYLPNVKRPDLVDKINSKSSRRTETPSPR